MRQKIQELQEYQKMKSDANSLSLLKAIKTTLLIIYHKKTLHRHFLKQQIDSNNSAGSEHFISRVHGQIPKCHQ